MMIFLKYILIKNYPNFLNSEYSLISVVRHDSRLIILIESKLNVAKTAPVRL